MRQQTVTPTQARIFDLAAATLRARGTRAPESWSDPSLERISERPRRVRPAVQRPPAPVERLTPEERDARAQRALQRVVDDLTSELPAGDRQKASAREVFRALVAVALDQAQRRQYRAAPSQVTYLLGVENLAYAFGVSQPTIWRRLEELRAAGLVATRRWYTRVDGEGRTAGTLFSVRLVAGTAKVHHEALTASWRDLQSDIAEGRSWRKERARLEFTGGLNGLEGLSEGEWRTDWLLTTALSPQPAEGSVNLIHSAPAGVAPAELVELFDLPGLARADRAERVDAVAHTIAAGLRDLRNINVHRWTIWQALRLADQGQAWAIEALYSTAVRVIDNARDTDRELRRPGAAYVAALRASGVWDGLKAAPQHRVGTVAA